MCNRLDLTSTNCLCRSRGTQTAAHRKACTHNNSRIWALTAAQPIIVNGTGFRTKICIIVTPISASFETRNILLHIVLACSFLIIAARSTQSDQCAMHDDTCTSTTNPPCVTCENQDRLHSPDKK
eukprot:m.583639 g.583639  ORF g.583639 m.583639 type:complete len:125 (-) comp22339_c1_seq14:986-1360(-)